MCKPMKKQMFSKAAITCMGCGCLNKIYYSSEDIEAPLYCERHRTEEGRHSAMRRLR